MCSGTILRVGLRPYPVPDSENPSPSLPLVRIGLFARWTTSVNTGISSVPGQYYARPTLIAPELPYSVIPRQIMDAGNLQCMPAATRLPTPTWRGVACQWVQAQVWFRNDLRPAGHPDAWVAFAVLGLLPGADPPGPPPFLYLGTHFFTHHTQLRLHLRYGDIRHSPTGDPLPFSDCGEILG